jgi:hypothetical protein
VRTMSAIDVEGDEQLQLRYEHQEFLPGAAMNSMTRPVPSHPLSLFDTTQKSGAISCTRLGHFAVSDGAIYFRSHGAALTADLYGPAHQVALVGNLSLIIEQSE